jgi:hypothetical protein
MVERGEDGFFDRWSRRKRGDSVPDVPETETVAVLTPAEEDLDAGDPEVIAKLPDLDNLTEETDFTAFLKEGVPEALRRQALRRLWRLNPVFAVLDGLNDYDEDYSAGGIIAENIKTIYKVGKGYLDDDEPETEDEPGDEDAVAAAELEPEPEPESAPESEAPTPGDPGPPSERDAETKSEKPVRGSALARRWGETPDKA